MGLTFQQKFYQVPNEVLIIRRKSGEVFGIIEVPEEEEKERELISSMKLSDNFLTVQKVDLDDLILNGYSLLKEKEIDREYFNIY